MSTATRLERAVTVLDIPPVDVGELTYIGSELSNDDIRNLRWLLVACTSAVLADFHDVPCSVIRRLVEKMNPNYRTPS
jgi:hypothetical protein